MNLSLVPLPALSSCACRAALLVACWLLAGAGPRAAAQAQAADPGAAPSDVASVAPSEPHEIPAPANLEPAGYSEAIDAAIHEHELGHFEEARELLLRAHALLPNARTLRGLGKVEYELRNYGESVKYLQQALSSLVKPLDAGLRLDVEQLLAQASVYVGEVHVAIEPGSATVSVDGVTIASGPQASFSLLVGQHVLDFRAQGRLPERRAIHVKGGEQTSIQVVLSPPVSSPPAPLGPSERSEAQPLRQRWWLWTAVGIVAAGATVGIVLATRSEERSRQAEPITTINTVPGPVIQALGARP